MKITFVPFSPLSRGLFSNTLDKDKFDKNDFRKLLPRFSGDHWENNRTLASAFADMAAAKNCTSAQLAIAWVLAHGDSIVPIPGTRHRKYLEENAAAVNISLSFSDLNDIDNLLMRYQDIGSRYTANFAGQVDKQ